MRLGQEEVTMGFGECNEKTLKRVSDHSYSKCQDML